MAIKRMIKVLTSPDDAVGELFDLWEFRSIQRAERYNQETNVMEYLIMINKNAIATNYNDLEVLFANKEDRDNEILRLQEILENDEDIIVL